MGIVHHHLLYQSEVGNADLGVDSKDVLKKFLYDLVNEINMECLIAPQLKFSHQKAWTGLIGIVTSHISFHFWTKEKLLQLDIYSCKEFDRKKAIDFITRFWGATDVKTLFVDREVGKNFKVE